MMNAKKYDRRSGFRYVLRAEDRNSGRISRSLLWASSRIFKVKVYDLSFTGLSFILDESVAPLLGERISLEFTVPETTQMAWYGEVVRIERVEDFSNFEGESPVKVAVRFVKLPPQIQNRIDEKLKLAEDHSDFRNVIPIKEETIYIEVKSGPSPLAKWTLRGTMVIVLLAAVYGASQFAKEIISLTLKPNKAKIMPPKIPK